MIWLFFTVAVSFWRNLLQDEAGHLKIGEYWVQMLYEQINPNQENGKSFFWLFSFPY